MEKPSRNALVAKNDKKKMSTELILQKLPNIVLILWHYNNEVIRPYPYCGRREIICGPKLQNKDTKERRFIKTNGRFFNIDEIIYDLDEKDQNIDFILAPLEVNVTCFPRNLSKIDCPKLGFVFDTHHLKYSISTLIEYAKSEKFTHIFMYAQPAHLHFFYEAGLTNSAFFPPNWIEFENRDNKKTGVTYIGKIWKSTHIRRCRMLQFLKKQLPKYNIPFHHYVRLPRPIWLKALERSRMIVLSSLNGQFTPQIKSCLLAGALCFIDELSPQTFLYQFFEPGKHIITWRNFEDLLEKIRYYYQNPKEGDKIAKAGQIQARRSFVNPVHMGIKISEFVFENKIDPRYLSINDKRCNQNRKESVEYFNARVRLYENIQELHRIHESLSLISMTERVFKPTADLADLPRLDITHAFRSSNIKKEGDLFFKDVGVNKQIHSIKLDEIQNPYTYDIGVLETTERQVDWQFLVNTISNLVKKNSLLFIFGKLFPFHYKDLEREGFIEFIVKKNQNTLKIRELSKNICMQFWKYGKYPLPYLTIKPSMETVSNLNIFLRGWQGKIPFLY